jgi:ribosomal protein L15
LSSARIDNKQAKKSEEGIKIHLDSLGYDKLLRGGKVTQPLFVQINSYSESAAKKIKKVEGKIFPTNTRRN